MLRFLKISEFSTNRTTGVLDELSLVQPTSETEFGVYSA